MREIENSRFLLECSGRTFYANGYIGALQTHEGRVDIAEGYDGYIQPETGNFDIDYDEYQLTTDEKIEIANYMIDLWERFKVQYTYP